jgi:hypothetical protein
LSALIWSSLSATIRFNLAFSPSSSFRRLASSASAHLRGPLISPGHHIAADLR